MWPWLQYKTAEEVVCGVRELDCMFAGTTKYGVDAITSHREGCVRAIRAISGKHLLHDSRVMIRKAYDMALCSSKICVSPWGYGEMAYRDYEALFAGCVLIKPDTSFVKTDPNILTADSVWFCKSDWSDLKDVVTNILDCWEETTALRIYNCKRMRQCYQASYVAAQYARLFHEAIRRYGNAQSDRQAN